MLLDEGEDLQREGAVATQQVFDPRHVDPGPMGEGLPGVPQRLVTIGTEKWDPVGA